MNTTMMRTMIAAAALVVAAGSASAQVFTAEVPIAFQAGGKTMAPGTYDVKLTYGAASQMIVFYNHNDKSSVALLPGVAGDAPKTWLERRLPTIAFECVAGTCSLRKLWNGSDSFAFQFPGRKNAGDLTAHRSDLVTLSMVRVR